jgi:proteasome lid subunit RPN8/RPN11
MFRAVFQGTIIRNEPAYKPRPAAMAGYHKFTNGAYDAFVALAALEAIADKTRRAAPNEMIGYLVGRPFRDAGGPYAVISAAVFADSARCGPVTVETTLDDERGLLATLLADHPLAEKLGWLHSHPFFLPSYSDVDLENQRFWSEPYHLGLLACLDPAGTVSVYAFRGPESEPIFPPHMACGPHNGPPPFRSVPGAHKGETTPKTQTTPKAAGSAERTTRRSWGLALLALAILVVWPTVDLIGARMIVQAIREGRDGQDGEPTTPPVKPAEPPAPKRHPPADDR